MGAGALERAVCRLATQGQRGAALMTLIQSARLNGHNPYVYLKDVLMRLPTQKASALAELLPHNWVPAGKV